MSGWNFAAELAAHGPGSPPARSLLAARSYCTRVARTHYENFAVASVLLPRRLLPHFHAVYSYCRWADDLADETGDGAVSLLSWWRGELMKMSSVAGVCDPGRTGLTEAGYSGHPVFVALADTVRRFALPTEPFLNLLTAFEQDQRVKRYATFADLLGYCANSANPVGRLVLHLFGHHDAHRAELSDAVCTGLQLANFWQDVARDYAIGRVYLPGEDLRRYGVSEADIAVGRCSETFRELLRFEVERTRGYFERGRGLLPLLSRELRPTVELFVRGGECTLDAVERQRFDVLTKRPTVGNGRKLWLLLQAAVGYYL